MLKGPSKCVSLIKLKTRLTYFNGHVQFLLQLQINLNFTILK